MARDEELLQQINEDRALGSELLFRHRHEDESPPYHVQLLDLWRCANEFVAIEVFREGAKSTLSEEFIALEGCFGNFYYGLLIGETYEKACERLEAIDYECRTNIKLHRMFGGPVLARKSIENKIWFRSGAFVQAVGWEQELQSFKKREHRPDRAWMDDPENQERVRDSAAVDASMKKLWLELVPAMDKKRRKIRLTQTRRASDCMMVRCANNPEFVYYKVPICNGEIDNPETKSNWPSRYPMSWIRKERDTYRGAGKLKEFMQSYMLIVSDPEAKPFKEEDIAYMDMAPYRHMPKYSIYDPARTHTPGKSDEYGKVVVSRYGTKIIVHESDGRNWQPSEFVEDLFKTEREHHCVAHGIEQNSLNDWLMQPIRSECMKTGVTITVKPLQAPQDRNKDQFIQGLENFFRARDIVLIGGKSAHMKLISEILNFPEGSKNILNALAYCFRMFSGQIVYEDFGQDNIAEAREAGRGDTVFLFFNASPSEVTVSCWLRSRRHWQCAADFTATGAIADCIRFIKADIVTTFKDCKFEAWVPETIFEQWQRIPLFQQIQAQGFKCYRGEHPAVARGSLSELIRTTIGNRRLLTVDPSAIRTINAFAEGYKYPALKGGGNAVEPERGTSQLLIEGVECALASMDKIQSQEKMTGVNHSVTPGGKRYASIIPGGR